MTGLDRLWYRKAGVADSWPTVGEMENQSWCGIIITLARKKKDIGDEEQGGSEEAMGTQKRTADAASVLRKVAEFPVQNGPIHACF
jgi:hypothetical protein